MKRLAILLGLAVLLLGALGASAATTTPLAGDLDPSFGTGGVVTANGVGLNALAVQPDGKIVAVGGSDDGELLLARYLPNGSPDPSFGDGGSVEGRFLLGGAADRGGAIAAVAFQPDGKIVGAGVSYQDDPPYPGTGPDSEFALARFNPNGSPDTSFGSNGVVNTVIPGQPNDIWSAKADAVTILRGGQILAAGLAYSQDCCSGTTLGTFALAEYTSDGSLDSTFGEGGIVQTSFTGSADVTSLAVRSDGTIMATGPDLDESHGGDVYATALARYEPDGSLDTGFGAAGKVETPMKLRYVGGPSALQGGKIVVAAFRSNNFGNSLFPVIARFGANGRIDPMFGKHGYAEIRSLGGDAVGALVAQPDGKILLATGAGVVRLTANGHLDPSFGLQGATTLGTGVGSSLLALQPDGNVLTGGSVAVEGGNPFAFTLARVLGGNNCAVPGLREKTVSKARATLRASYCRPGSVTRLYSNRVARGHVITTAPLLGDRRPGGTKVDLIVSRGRRARHS